MKHRTPIDLRIKTHLLLGLLIAGLGAIGFGLAALHAAPPAIKLVVLKTPPNSPIPSGLIFTRTSSMPKTALEI
jgi:hypothetical protein